jgi:hypothetical protein
LRKIEAARHISEVIANSSNTIYLNSDNLLFNLIGVTSPKSTERISLSSQLFTPIYKHSQDI